MKHIRQQFIWASIILGLAAGLTGCVKGGASVNSTAISYVSLINEAPYSVPVDIYFGATLVTPSGGIAPGKFSLAYGQLKPGTYEVDFKKAGTDSVIAVIPSTDYDTSAFYTLVLYNVNADSTRAQAARIMDDFSQVTTTNSYYRFFNFAPDIPGAALSLNGTVVQSNRTPADNIVTSAAYNAFVSIPPALYTLQVQNSVSDSVLGSVSGAQLVEGYAYTIFLGGTAKTGYSLNVLQEVF